jgi:hypothetical protein
MEVWMSEVYVNHNDPIGTLDEIKALGMDPRKVGSCSLRTGGVDSNTGCPWFKQCRFHQWRDGVGGRKGPLNIGVDIMLGQVDGGAWDQKQMACFQYYSSGLALRAKNTDRTGEVIRIIAYEGDDKELSERISKRENPADPNDKRMVSTVENRTVQPFPRPATQYPVYQRREQARLEALDEIEADALKKALARTQDGKTPLVGEPKKVVRT